MHALVAGLRPLGSHPRVLPPGGGAELELWGPLSLFRQGRYDSAQARLLSLFFLVLFFYGPELWGPLSLFRQGGTTRRRRARPSSSFLFLFNLIVLFS